MRRFLPATTPRTVLLATMLLAASVLISPSRAVAASDEKAVTVDYVIALLDAGVDQAKVIDRIEQKGLTFRLAPGDMSRLRSAGADDKLIESVVDHAAVLEGHGGPGPKAGQEQPPTQDTDHWGRPSRLGRPGTPGSSDAPAAPDQEQATPPGDEGEQQYQQQSGGDGQGIEEEPYGGSYGYYYPGYYSGYYDFYYGYPYPYYYSYPYGAYFYYSYPYYHYYPRHYFYGGFGRGGARAIPRGGHGTMPRSGGGFHSTPRSSPRGSHH